MRHHRSALALCALLLLSACPKKDGGGGGSTSIPRCEVDLGASGLFSMTGSGAQALTIDSEAQLIGGEGATGHAGDVLLKNDKIRVVIERAGRVVGPILSGGHIVDADVVRADREPGRDVFGRMGLVYGLGRLSSIAQVEVLADGSSGGPAVVASTGRDSQHDLINLKSMLLTQAGLSVQFVLDPDKPIPVRSTTYYVLSPGESRVRMLTAFCNEGTATAVMPLVEILDVGAFGLFNPGGCSNGLGSSGLDDTNCILEPSKWVGTQGSGISYALRSQSLEDLTQPIASNAMLGYGGIVGAFIGGENVNGVLSWTDPEARSRPGSFAVRAGGQRSYLRDFFVAKDLAGITDALATVDGTPTGTVEVTARLPGGAAAPGARISIVDVATGKMTTLIEADGAGRGSARLPAGTWRLSAALEGRPVGPAVEVSLAAGATVPVALTLGDSHTLTVHVKDPFGAAMPAKVMVRCSPAPCAFNFETWKQHLRLENYSNRAAAIGFVPVQGTLELPLPPGRYDVAVSRGPEFNVWPETWPQSGAAVDLTTYDAELNAVLARVVDSTGWMSADLHVHAANSSDSAVNNEVRVASFMAEGVDVLLSTDHDYITDFAPHIRALGAENFIASMIGAEVTSFTYGHFNSFPLIRGDTPNGGAFDHAGGEDGPTLRLTELFPGIKAVHPDAVVQVNHPRGGSGAFTQLRLDTGTLKSHADPANFGMAPAPDATADDTKVFGDGFDAVECANGPTPSFTVLNDWMTFLSRGTVRASTGVSDTHDARSSTGGYARTYAQVGVDAPADFTSHAYAEAIRTQRAFVTNGPYLTVSARKLDGAGQPVGAPVAIGGTLSITSGDAVELTVEVQAPETMPFDRVELYTHAPGRESFDGEGNSSWPDGRIAESKVVDTANLPLEAVPGTNGVALRRIHGTWRFVVHPAADTWLVAMVRGVGTRALWPLHGDRAIAWSNAILIDADGSGRYDDFPLKPGQPLRATHHTVLPPHVPAPLELQRAIIKLLEHKHG